MEQGSIPQFVAIDSDIYIGQKGRNKSPSKVSELICY